MLQHLQKAYGKMSCPASGDATDLEGSSQPVLLVSGTTAEQWSDISILHQSPVSLFKNGPTIKTDPDGLGQGPRNVNFKRFPSNDSGPHGKYGKAWYTGLKDVCHAGAWYHLHRSEFSIPAVPTQGPGYFRKYRCPG